MCQIVYLIGRSSREWAGVQELIAEEGARRVYRLAGLYQEGWRGDGGGGVTISTRIIRVMPPQPASGVAGVIVDGQR